MQLENITMHILQAFQIDLKNAKNEEVEVVVQEPIPGDWKMKKQSHNHEKVASGTAEWRIKGTSRRQNYAYIMKC